MLFHAKEVEWWVQAFSCEKKWYLLTILVAKTTLEFLYDVKVVMGLICIMPMLEGVHVLIMFAQSCDTFVYDFLQAMEMCSANLYLFYCVPKKIYTNFQFIMDCTNDRLLTTWWTNPANIINVSFFIFKVTIWIHYKCLSIGVFAMCTCDEWYVVATTMKLQCYIAIPSLIKEFVQRSPSEKLMNWCY
jgi:hypothetical protein